MICMQKASLPQSQLFCAVLTADSVSWFKLQNATSVKPITTKSIAPSEGESSSQNVLTRNDSKWLNAHFTSLHFQMPVQLHIYGARPTSSADPTSGTAQGQSLPKAIAKAANAVTEDLCSPSAALIASTSSTGAHAYSAALLSYGLQHNISPKSRCKCWPRGTCSLKVCLSMSTLPDKLLSNATATPTDGNIVG